MRPRWFQIHLSTSVALMILGGALLGANMLPRDYAPKVPETYTSGDLDGLSVRTWGWPYAYGYSFERISKIGEEGNREMVEYNRRFMEAVSIQDTAKAEAIFKQLDRTIAKQQAVAAIILELSRITRGAIMMNIVVNIALLFATGILCEFFSRRYRRHPQQAQGEQNG